MEAPLVEAKPAPPAHLSHETVPWLAYGCQFMGILGAFLIFFSLCIPDEWEFGLHDIKKYILGAGISGVCLPVVEVWTCKTFQYLGHVRSEADFIKRFARMRGADPSIVFRVENVAYSDGEKKVQATFKMPYEIAGSVDETMTEAEFKATCQGDGGGRCILTMNLPLSVTPVDEPTRKHYSDTRTNFAASHKDVTLQQEINDENTLDGHEEFCLVVMGGDGTVPLWMTRPVFILCSVIPFSTIIYRMTLFRMTKSMEIPVTKRFSVRITP